MSDNTARLRLSQLAAGQAQMSVTHNEALVQIDALSDLYLKGQFVNDPPAAPADGDAYLVGDTPTGAWSGYAYKIASCLDGAWRFYTPFDGLCAFVATTNAFIVYQAGTWTDWNSLISANAVSVASAATCDLGAVGSLFVVITGTVAIASFGSARNALRFVRFANTLTLTHSATSLILRGAADRVTAPGDTGIYASDGSGNWREISYARADGSYDLPHGGSVDSFGGVGIHGQRWGAWYSACDTQDNGEVSGVAIVNDAQAGICSAGIGFVGKDGSGSLQWKAGIAGGVYGEDFLAFRTGSNTERMRLTPTQLLIGVSGNAWAPFATFYVQRADAGQAAYFYVTDTSTANTVIGARSDNTNSHFMDFNHAGANVGNITDNGTSVSYNTTSDARLKTKLAAQRDFGAIVDALWFGDVAFKSDAAQTPYLMCIAQDVFPHFPDVVSRPADPDAMWGVDYSRFAPLAMWAVQDLRTRVAALEAAVAGLKGGAG